MHQAISVNMELIGVSKRYYEYIQLLISQSESGGPFDTTPVALRGNCTNQTIQITMPMVILD